MKQRRAILTQILQRGLGFQRQVMAVDVDAVEEFVLGLIPLAGRADHTDLRARRNQGPAFVHHPPVERQRQILDDDQDLAALKRFGFADRVKVGHMYSLPIRCALHYYS